MDTTVIKTVAGEMLDLALTEDEALALKAPLEGLRKMVQVIEAVPLPFPGEPFVSPRLGDENNWGQVHITKQTQA